MHIVCPHCSTSYAINPANLGETGRTVRCSRCKETWLAHPEDAVEAVAAEPVKERISHVSGRSDSAAKWEAPARGWGHQETPVVDSPSIASGWPGDGLAQDSNRDWMSEPSQDALDAEISRQQRRPWFRRLLPWRASHQSPRVSVFSLPTTCAGMGALVAALIIWRADVVRLLPQTALFYNMTGLEVNLRGVQFKDVKISDETVEGKPVLVIEGVIVGTTRKPVDLPRLRFSVRDEKGSEIYAWNAVLEQSVLKPGERVWFRSRLASPPSQGRNIDIRFFNRRDLAGGST